MKKIIILSVTGGGIRGIIASRFLEHLESYIREKKIQFSLYDIFDVYAGTSTGALIVSAIAYRKLSASYITNELYSYENANKMMKQTWVDKIFGLFQNRPKYDGIGKKEIINQFCQDISLRNTDKLVFIPVYNITQRKPEILKSCELENYKLSTILDATTAAPSYFPSVELRKNEWGVDGSMFANNPCLNAYLEILKRYKNEDLDVRILSIGTGYKKNKNIKKESEKWGLINWALNGDLLDVIMDGPEENENIQMKQITKMFNHKYLEINEIIKDTELDDVSYNNIKNLREHGDTLWYTYGNKTIRLLFDSI